MKVIRSVEALREELQAYRDAKKQIGFVPTMGFLHDGHKSLMQRAKHENEVVVLSIFVNPLQFGPNEDFDRYPRDEDHDLHVASNAHVDIVFMPSVEEMYPVDMQVTMVVGDIANKLCGQSRPGHFDGVATVVMKLFQMVQPNRAYFGLKDAQQVAVIQTMVNDFNLQVEIVPCSIIRETDGLAMSSRNVYLSDEERWQALAINQSLTIAKRQIEERENIRINELKASIESNILNHALANIDYVQIVSYPSLMELQDTLQLEQVVDNFEQILIAVAVKYGKHD